ncbi:DUF664 domain-containing protein [Micromonospora sp. WMMD967]|nr:DUF664 domain-containing protein [Micromonospora sp. WMMD967]MDG4837067.1 DUF664 domain-containing protein [Micromonospora sp. WMMD967]
MSKLWTEPEDDPRTFGQPAGEKATYREYLGNYRLTIEMKCDGLDAEQLGRRSVPPSTLSLPTSCASASTGEPACDPPGGGAA